MKHRKLFPSLAETNNTDCSGLCDPACPYNCYNDYYYLSPPPPPRPLSVEDSPTQNHHTSPYVIVTVSFFAGLFLLVGYYVIASKSCVGWCRSRNNRQPRVDGSDEEFIDENQVDHPIWFITTVGLQQSVINSITVCKYKKGEGLIEGTECSVCLTEFQEDELLRLLPKCNHAFHISCIDTWLRSHTNCPLCRAGIVFDGIRNAPMATRDRNSDPMDGISVTRNENSEIGGELNVGMENQERNSDVYENRGRTGDRRGGNVSKEKKVIRRSVSMDSSAAGNLSLALENLQRFESGVSSEEWKSNPGRKALGNSSSFSQFLHLSPVPMKRSFSCNGRFLSSKRGRSLN
ncbi:hypothetical protein SLEP1_g42120 [Rubroshorea leprosula]|uniref:RING-type E3 ubiquitin transferase n=1 Tax=Rubroshorea leprosula TaxID=152421 RepID=A0AAV5L9N3_9ROSI|nr:hypothetical protein SLEP1_g42120 [Rubroshorea leprosula]